MTDFSDDILLIQEIEAVPAILEILCRATGMGFSAVARVTEDRWISCAVKDEIGFGLEPGSELKIETTICHEIRQHRTPVTIDNVAEDPEYRDHHTPAIYGLQSYISMPIILSDGTFFGTLCAIDAVPRKVSEPYIVNMFALFAQMIGHHIEASYAYAVSTKKLLDEREASALREQFIAVLGHDLRNPLAGIRAGMSLLSKEPQTPRGTKIISMVDGTVSRMAGLIDNVMDFAHGRLGDGIPLIKTRSRLGRVLEQVAAELSVSNRDRTIITSFNADPEIEADHSRLGQLFSNLLGNAITHGDAALPIVAEADIVDGFFEFRTINGGEPIPPAVMERLFSPFARGEIRSSLQGLGLGLYIASQIARAHGGVLTASSNAKETIFLFRMPLTS